MAHRLSDEQQQGFGGTVPFEAIMCPSCGSSEVTEYKADSYVCRHCDTAFRLVQPSSATVTVRSDFCRCGNVPEAQCGTCQAAVCGRCVSGRAENGRHHDPLLTNGDWFELVAVRSGGYQLEVGRRSGDFFSCHTAVGGWLQWRGNALEHGSWRPVSVSDSGVIDGYVPLGKVQDYLSRSGARGYVCLSCLSEAAERVCAELAHGVVCMNPFCGRAASGVCPCCAEANCGECLYKSLPGYKCPPRFMRTLEEGTPEAALDAPAVCASCYAEYDLSADDLTPVPKPKPRRSTKAHIKAWSERNALVAELAMETSERWSQQLRAGCRRRSDSPSGTIRYRVRQAR